MKPIHTELSQRRAAFLAGIGFLISFFGALFTTIFVNKLIVPGDASTTASNILASESLFRAGIISWLLVILGDILRAWALYVFLKPINRNLALLSAWFMLIHDAILAVSLINLVNAAVLASGGEILAIQGSDALLSQMMLYLQGFDTGFIIGLFFFSFHLGILGILVYRSGFMPRFLSVLLLIAAAGYLVNSAGTIIQPELPELIWTLLSGPCLIGEMALIVWLVFKGGKATFTNSMTATIKES